MVGEVRGTEINWSEPKVIDEIRYEVSYPQFLNYQDQICGVYTFNRRMIKFIDLENTALEDSNVNKLNKEGISRFKNLHSEKSLFILASGPSLGKLDLSPLQRRIVMGLNRSFKIYEDSHYHCMMDQRLFEKYDQLQDHRCVFTLKGRPWGIPLHYLGGEGFSLDLEDGIYTGYTIAYFALQLAVYMGFKKIFYLGLDLSNYGGQTHFFGHDFHSANHNDTEFPRMRAAFQKAKAQLDKLGVDVYNCSMESTLQVFPKITFEEAIKRS